MRHSLRSALGAVVLTSSTVLAAPTDIEVHEHPLLRGSQAGLAPHDIDGKPYMMKQIGAGFEHANVAVCGNYFLIAGVGSYERDAIGVTPDMHAYGKPIRDNDRLQTMMVAAQLTESGLEVGGAYYVFPDLTGGDRNRDGLKPEVACLDPVNGLFVVDANYAPDNLARTYAAVFQVGRSDLNNDLVATQLSPATMVLESTDDNCSDRDYQDMIVRTTPGGYRVNLTGSCNGNGADVAWVTYIDLACSGANCTVTAGPKAQVSQGQIERFRAQSFQIGPDSFLTIGTEGDSQPPMDGISATIYNGDTLTMISSSTIAERIDTNLGTYYSTMSHAGQLGPDTFLVSYQQRNGRQRREGKGGATLVMGVLKATATDGASWLVAPKPDLIPGFGATHHGSCTTSYGDVATAQPAAFLVSASPTGGTAAKGTFVTYENGAVKVGTTVDLASNIDSALLANYYGENPGNQGKNSIYCATIDNPGYRVKGAYRADVKQFVVVPATSRVLDANGVLAEKLALDIVLVPAVWDSTFDPEADTGDQPAGCGCQAPSEGSLASGLLIGLAITIQIRRRRRAS